MMTGGKMASASPQEMLWTRGGDAWSFTCTTYASMKPSMSNGLIDHQLVGTFGATVVMTCRSKEPSPALPNVVWPRHRWRPSMLIFGAGPGKPYALRICSRSVCKNSSSLNSPTACAAAPLHELRFALMPSAGMSMSRSVAAKLCAMSGSTKSTGALLGPRPKSTSHSRVMPTPRSLRDVPLQSQPVAENGASLPLVSLPWMQTAARSTGLKLARPPIEATAKRDPGRRRSKSSLPRTLE
mmetsp:Transcript_90169/g.254313  ORF Transcript_90169/g.254313 Transcript_90169/m.254313 type:complete len:240 (-) Transcript_90169:1003-1722(-)